MHIAVDQFRFTESCDEFTVAAVEQVVGDLTAGAIRAHELDHGTFLIFEDEDIALDDVIKAVILGEESDAFVGDDTVVEDEPVFVHTTDPDACDLTGNITVVDDVAWAVGTMCAVFRR